MTHPKSIGQTGSRASLEKQVSQEAWIILSVETLLFLVLLHSLFRAKRKLSPLLKGLSQTLFKGLSLEDQLQSI